MSSNVHPTFSQALKPTASGAQRLPFYLIESTWGDCTFTHEQNRDDADLDTVVQHIAEGQFFPSGYSTGTITAVYYCSPASGAMEDATDRVLKRVGAYLDRTNTAPCYKLANLLDWAGVELSRSLAAE